MFKEKNIAPTTEENDNEKRSSASWRIKKAPKGGFDVEKQRALETVPSDFEEKKDVMEKKYGKELSEAEENYLKFFYARAEDELHKKARDRALINAVAILRKEIDKKDPMSIKVGVKLDILLAMYEKAGNAEEELDRPLLAKAEEYIEMEDEIKRQHGDLWEQREFTMSYERLKYFLEQEDKLEPGIFNHVLKDILFRLSRYLIIKEQDSVEED